MEDIFNLLTRYRYFVLFPLAIVEGPIIAVIAGFLCTSQFLNAFIVYPVIVAGDITGDSICYMFGRWGLPPFLKRLGKRLGMSSEKKERVLSYFTANPSKTISLSKIALGVGVAGIYIAGNAKVPYQRFILICLVTSALQYIVYVGVGILFGRAYEKINRYLDIYAALVSVTVIAAILFFIVTSTRKKI